METPPSSRISTLVPILTTTRLEAATCSRGESSVRWDLAVPMAFLLGADSYANPCAGSQKSAFCRCTVPRSEWAYRYSASPRKGPQGFRVLATYFRTRQFQRIGRLLLSKASPRQYAVPNAFPLAPVL